ncbi:sensor domain-containing phosphodiesterase [Kosakonia sp. SMBL-WEM22]|uniref:sensor domain-containing diguanylate cyclase n=1 Tax=Kosakonia sp. SMBL-WEM22 TaxID=2725560 RepID=UPI00165A059C|nr:sensor domain-containing phosphodiesterase [Kosakonia sp. SMBL-WEM22]QNQ20055.1 sensor domain-containing phosphodiesterase [Kosakonia sp. SMBL-WEM22]
MFTGLKKSESKQLAALELLSKADPARDAALAEFARLASEVMGVSGCFITTFDDEFQYIKFVENVPIEHNKIAIHKTMCQYSLADRQMIVCNDARIDARFSHQPLVNSGDILFYASMPMIAREGTIFGTLCVTHPDIYKPNARQIANFERIAALATLYLESCYNIGLVDALTGLPNRPCLIKEMTRLKQNASGDYALIIFDCIDIPRAYELTRYLGVEALETLLRSFGPLLQMRLRLNQSTTLYAFATGRFAVLTERDAALRLTKRVEKSHAFQATIGSDININLSIHAGFVPFKPETDNVQEVVRQAISALHEAIRENNPVLLFNPILDHQRNKDFRLLYDLSQAIKSGDQLYMAYQPKVSLRSGRTEGVEALLRWTHPGLGPISPALIVTLAEKTSLMADITRWVIKTVIIQAKAWKAIGIDLPVSINVTVSDFSRTGFADELAQHIIFAGLTPADIHIECLETEKVLESDAALRELNRLKALGFTILLDDFGAGYSNISYLRRIPIDMIKLDRSLVSQIATDNDSRIIARNVIMMLKELNYVVLAEGVEDLDTARMLEEYGCDEAQGYLFARPLLAADIPAWLVDSKPWRLLAKIHTNPQHHLGR